MIVNKITETIIVRKTIAVLLNNSMMNLLKGCLTLLLPINSTPDLSGLLGSKCSSCIFVRIAI